MNSRTLNTNGMPIQSNPNLYIKNQLIHGRNALFDTPSSGHQPAHSFQDCWKTYAVDAAWQRKITLVCATCLSSQRVICC